MTLFGDTRPAPKPPRTCYVCGIRLKPAEVARCEPCVRLERAQLEQRGLPTTPQPRSVEASASWSEGAAGLARHRVVEYVRSCGERGATCDEAEVALNMSHQTCSPRFNEMAGRSANKKLPTLIYPNGKKRPTRSGRAADVHVAVEFLGPLETQP